MTQCSLNGWRSSHHRAVVVVVEFDGAGAVAVAVAVALVVSRVVLVALVILVVSVAVSGFSGLVLRVVTMLIVVVMFLWPN